MGLEARRPRRRARAWAWVLGGLLVAGATAQAAETVRVLADFEDGLGGWTAEGDAFGVSAVEGDRWQRRGEGGFFADSLHRSEQATGILRSPEFPCPDEVRFLANGWDRRDGSGGRNFYRLRLSDGTAIAESGPPLCTGRFVPMRWQVTEHKGKPVRIEVVDGAADGSFAWLAIDAVELVDLGALVPADQSDLYAVGAQAEAGRVWGPGWSFATWPEPPRYDKATHAIALDCPVSEVYLLGHVSTFDRGCPPWPWHTDFTRDFTRQQMIGDQVGEVRIEYSDGTATVVPLIFGFTMWWDKPWRENREPIASREAARRAFEASCHLKEVTMADGGSRYVSAIACGGKTVRRVVFVDSPAKEGCPAFWGMSVRTDRPGEGMLRLAHHARDGEWLEAHRITGERLAGQGHLTALRALKSEIGMTDADLPETVAPDVPEGFRGPRMTLTGGVSGDILTNAYLHTTHSAASRSIREDGYIYCAPPDRPDYNAYDSIGTYQVISRGASSSWTRGYEYIRDLAAWGYVDEVTRAVDWADTCLYYYPRECELRYERDGEKVPWPAHWATMADHPEGTLRPGNNEIPGDENDGHALTMMMRYAAWVALGRDTDWLRARWQPAVNAAEWLCFVLDYTGQDVLYCESEGTCYGAGFDAKAERPYDAYPHYDIFTNVLGALALRQSADMAEALGEGERAARWRGYAARIEQGTRRRCVEEDPRYGTVWRVHPNSVWPQFDERLAPVFELPYYRGFDAGALDEEALRISRNSFRLQIGDPPDYHHGLGLGYGQGWITAAALLLDEMGAARPLLENLARYIYFPKHPHPFIATEGVVVNEDGDFRVLMGTVGIDEGLFVTRVFRVMMGVDDTRPEETVLLPRLPEGFSGIRVSDHPVVTVADGRTARASVSYSYRKSAGGAELTVSATAPIAHLRARLGPFGKAGRAARVTVNGAEREEAFVRSGEAWWVWVDLGREIRRATCRVTR